MRPFTKEEMARLQAIEPRMRQARFDYLSSLYTEQKELVADIYKAAGGQRQISWGCGNCWLAVVKEIGEQYFSQREAEAKNAAKKSAQKKAK